MTEQAAVKRPKRITTICIINAIGLILAVPLALSAVARAIGPWYPPYLLASALAGAVCTVGFWLMRKWGAVAYAVLVVINQGVLLVMGAWNIFGLLIPGVVVAIVFSVYKQMR